MVRVRHVPIPALTYFPYSLDSDEVIHQMPTALIQPQLSLEDKKIEQGANIKKNDVWLQISDAHNGSAGAKETRELSHRQHEDENIYHYNLMGQVFSSFPSVILWWFNQVTVTFYPA